jgi:hypothetical protein
MRYNKNDIRQHSFNNEKWLSDIIVILRTLTTIVINIVKMNSQSTKKQLNHFLKESLLNG